MPLKNYSTEVPAGKSVGEIHGKLVAHGAKAIMTNYGPDGEPESLSFIVPGPQGDIPFKLPANVKKVEVLLLKMRTKKPETWHADYARVMERIHNQASKVAWRIIKDWVDSQLALIETEMVTLEEVFLAYMLLPGKKTLYEVMVNKGFILPEGKG